jgi:hypothetical protein
MSFFSDLVEGNFGNLGTDISHAPSSLANHPLEIGETAAAIATIASLGTLGPEAFGALGATEGALGAADLGAADAAFGAFVPEAFAAESAGLGAAELGAADLGLGAAEAADLGLGTDFGFGAAGGLPSEALAFAPGATSFDTAGLFDISGAGLGFDVLGDPAVAGYTDFGAATPAGFASTDAELSGGLTGTAPPSAGGGAGAAPPSAGGGAGAAPGGAGATATPAGFAPTDAELSGAVTGTGPAAAGGGGFNSLIQGAGGWGNILKYGAAVAPLALTLGMGEAKLSPAAQQLQAQANALSQQGMSDLASARAGKLNAGQTAQIGQMRNDLTNQWRQTLYNQGVTDISKDARWPQIEADIDAKVTTATAQLIQQNITNALAEAGLASSALTSIAQMQMAADTAFTNQLINATKALGGAFGGSQTITLKAA